MEVNLGINDKLYNGQMVVQGNQVTIVLTEPIQGGPYDGQSIIQKTLAEGKIPQDVLGQIINETIAVIGGPDREPWDEPTEAEEPAVEAPVVLQPEDHKQLGDKIGKFPIVGVRYEDATDEEGNVVGRKNVEYIIDKGIAPHDHVGVTFNKKNEPVSKKVKDPAHDDTCPHDTEVIPHS